MMTAMYTLDRRKYRRGGDTVPHLTRRMLAVALPLAVSAYARTSLTTLEHLLIPRGLKSAGLTADRALAGYGIVHGMALPVVLFPSCLLYALADLLVPELTTAQVSGRCGDIRRLVRTLLYRCLLFACGTAVLLLAFSGPLGRLIYHSDDAGRYIRLLAPLVPVMYLDTVTDGCLRGLGQQTRCMAINVFDATLGVVLVWALLPRFGLAGYIFILYFNECVNFTLSFTLLLRGRKTAGRLMPAGGFGMRLRSAPQCCGVGVLGCTDGVWFFLRSSGKSKNSTRLYSRYVSAESTMPLMRLNGTTANSTSVGTLVMPLFTAVPMATI